MTRADGFLRHPLLSASGVEHGFGTRASSKPAGLIRPRQVHGAGVVCVRAAERSRASRGDAIVSDAAGVPVAVATADCVPILVATPSGEAVAAIHAGWRGVARGVVPAAIEALERVGGVASRTVAVVGPHVGACCYEVDAPVVTALTPRLGDALGAALRPSRPGHWRLSLEILVRFELARAGIAPDRAGVVPEACTACDPVRFFSYRRDGPRTGRLVHFVVARERRNRR